MSDWPRSRKKEKRRKPNENTYPYKGQMLTVRELLELPEAKAAAITKELLSGRLTRGMRVSQAVSMPKQSLFGNTGFNRFEEARPKARGPRQS